MNLKWYYWYFESVVPERICDDIVEYGKKQEKQMALTGNSENKELTKTDKKTYKKKKI